MIDCKKILAHRDRETIYIKEEAGINSFICMKSNYSLPRI